MTELLKKIFPNWKWDAQAKAGILHLQEGEPAEQVEITVPRSNTKKKFIADLDEHGEVIAIEILQ